MSLLNPFHSDGFSHACWWNKYGIVYIFVFVLMGLPVRISITRSVVGTLILSLETVQALMKCRNMRHFIWVFTVCQSTCLPCLSVSRMKKVWYVRAVIFNLYRLDALLCIWHVKGVSIILNACLKNGNSNHYRFGFRTLFHFKRYNFYSLPRVLQSEMPKQSMVTDLVVTDLEVKVMIHLIVPI